MSALDIQAIHVDAEQNILGAVLMDAKCLDRIDLKVTDFSVDTHQTVWGCVSRMAANGEAIDVITVAERLNNRVELAYLGDLAANCVSTRNVEAWAKIVRESAIVRQLKDAAQAILSVSAKQIPLSQKIEEAQAAVMHVGESATGRHPRIIADILVDVIDEMQDRMEGRSNVPSVGIRPIDELANILVPGNLVVIAARPSMGKTAFALAISEKVASVGKSVLFCSQEMGGVSLVQRLIASIGKVSLGSLINASLNAEQMDRLTVATERLNAEKIIIDEQAALSLAEIRTKARQTKRKHGLDLIVVDYLQLMVGEGEIRHEEIAAISRGLKKLAMDMRVPVIALSQLNRGLEARADKRPVMSDLRESGQIEQDADVILMLYRDEIYDENSPNKGIAEILCRKNRQGKLGTAYMTFLGEFCAFEPFHGVIERPVKQERSTFKRGYK